MTLFYLSEVTAIAIIIILLMSDMHLRRRDTVEARRIFNIAVMVGIGSVINIILAHYNNILSLEETSKWYVVMASILSSCIKEIITLNIVIGWNLFVDYGIYKSYDHVFRKQKQALALLIVLSAIFFITFSLVDFFFLSRTAIIAFIRSFTFLSQLLQIVFIVNAVLIVLKAGKGRKPPTFLRLDAFIIPLLAGYVCSFIPVLWDYDYRSIFMAIAVAMTWRSVCNRYKYVDPYTGFYNKRFLSDMNEYMEKSGYPNGIGVLFKTHMDTDRFVTVLNELKPAESEIFTMNESAYLLLAAPQKESLIRLLIKSVKLKTAEVDSSADVESTYAIRKKEESTQDFTKRILALEKE